MLIEFLKDHGSYRVGQLVAHPHLGVADTLVRRGIARPAVVLQAAVERRPTATAKPKKVTRKP